MQKLKFKLETPECAPHIGTPDSAGLDLKVYVGGNPRINYVQIPVGAKVMVSTGVRAAIPKGWVGLVFPRSSVGSKLGVRLANTVGVIDADYRGEIKLVLENLGKEDVIFYNYDRVCQLVVVPFFPGELSEIVDDLDETERGEGGFGSTN